MVLSVSGLDLTEERLRKLCDCSPVFGTDALKAVEATRGLGFAGSAKYTLQYDELQNLVAGGWAVPDCLPESGSYRRGGGVTRRCGGGGG